MATQLAMGRFKTAEHFNNTWSAALSGEQSLEDALKPEFWAHVARFFRIGDLVRLLPEVGDYYAMLIVVGTGKTWAKVKLIHYVPLAATAEGYEEDEAAEEAGAAGSAVLDHGHVVEWKGPHRKYSVIRKSDGEYLKEGFTERKDAEQWLRDHLDTMAR